MAVKSFFYVSATARNLRMGANEGREGPGEQEEQVLQENGNSLKVSTSIVTYCTVCQSGTSLLKKIGNACPHPVMQYMYNS